MADKSLEDLDAELAALEAELAALERGEAPPPKTEKKEKKALPKPKLPFGRRKDEPAPGASAEPPARDAPAAKEPKGGMFGKLKMPKKSAAEPAPDSAPGSAPASSPASSPASAPAPAFAPAPASEPAPAGRARGPLPVPPLAGASWQLENGAWRRVAPAAPPPVYKRRLDADGNVIEEVLAEDADVRDARPEPEREAPRGLLGLQFPGGKSDVAEPSNGEPPRKGLSLRFGKLGRKK